VDAAAHGVADQQPLGQRSVIVAAMGGHGEDLRPLARQQYVVAADMADQHAAIGEVRESDALREVGAGRLGIVSHLVLP
jgi:hypothetical protein